MELLKLLKTKLLNQYLSNWIKGNIGQKPKSLNELTIIESKTSYWINMLLLHKHSAIGYKTEITEWIKTVEWNC